MDQREIEKRHCLSRTEFILRLYAKLEKIAKKDNNGTSKADFEEALNGITGTDLLHSSVLQGTITRNHRESDEALNNNEDEAVNGETLLFRAMTTHVEKGSKHEASIQQIIILLVKRFPSLIVYPKQDNNCRGITPIHLSILKEDRVMLKLMAKYLPYETMDTAKSKKIVADGTAFQNTAMMAGTLLGVAALKFNEKIFKDILDLFPSELEDTNEKGDNVIHSLIKYAHVCPDKCQAALKMMRYIMSCSFMKDKSKKKISITDESQSDTKDKENTWKMKRKVTKLLMMENKEKINPLQLAAKREQYEFFKEIMKHEEYCTKEISDGVYSEEVFDITEIESLPVQHDVQATDQEDIKSDHHESVLEYVVHHQTQNAFLFADFPPVKGVIKEKWKYYRWWFWAWFAIHIVFMINLSLSAIYRSILVDNTEYKFKYLVTRNDFVTSVSAIGLILGILNIVLEVKRELLSRFKFKVSSNRLRRFIRLLSSPYSNSMFRLYFLFFNLSLVVDFVVAAIAGRSPLPDYHNYLLIFAVIIGWYLFLFFLQGFKPFSFFTVLIQRLIVDLLKFAFVMTILLLAFSIAMFMIMQGADTEEDDFDHFGKTLVKMLTIMLGIGELNILFQARQPALAVTVFVLFVLLTTILLLNALIAIMSNACTDLMSNQGGFVATKMHCRLQKLSVILFLESYLPTRFCHEVGKIKQKCRYVNNEWDSNSRRRIWSLNSFQESNAEETKASYETIQNKQSPNVFAPQNNNRAPKRSRSNASVTPKEKDKKPSIRSRHLEISNIDRESCNECNTGEITRSETQVIELK